jgi:hypothetical protein
MVMALDEECVTARGLSNGQAAASDGRFSGRLSRHLKGRAAIILNSISSTGCCPDTSFQLYAYVTLCNIAPRIFDHADCNVSYQSDVAS